MYSFEFVKWVIPCKARASSRASTELGSAKRQINLRNWEIHRERLGLKKIRILE